MENEKNIALVIAIGILAIGFLIILVVIITSIFKRKIVAEQQKLAEIEKQKQIELFRATVNAGETERAKIATNLHDQVLPFIGLKANSLKRLVTNIQGHDSIVEEMHKEIEYFATLSTQLRGVAHDLVPSLFNTFGLIQSIEAFVKNINENSGSQAEFQNETNSKEISLPKNEQLNIYRICLEILNNLRKHANYDYLTVTVTENKNRFKIVFAHDGGGITNERIAELRESSRGIGLKSLESRALLLKASIDYSKDGDVSYVQLTVPIHEGNN
jgi:signal transduction histidine kinase